MARKAKKGIYCIEGFWEQGDVMNKASVLPLLELLENREHVPYTYHRCGTIEEIHYMLERWKGRVQQKHPILYFATHGNEGELDFGRNVKLEFTDLEELLAGKAHNSIILFGSCFTMKHDKRNITRFLKNTGALAAMGYTKRVDWMESASAELLTFYYIQDAQSFDTKGIKEIEKSMEPNKRYFSSLGFRMVSSKEHKPRRRK